MGVEGFTTARMQLELREWTPKGYLYSPVPVKSPDGRSILTTLAPAVGDLLEWVGGTYEVVSRSWLFASYGSMNWPYGKEPARDGVVLRLIVERAMGPFRDPAPYVEEPGDA